MKTCLCTIKRPAGFTLAEVVAAVVIGAMVLVAMLTVYTRAQGSAAAISRNLGKGRLPREVLQLIAEDIDKVIASDSDTSITINNKLVRGYPGAQLIIKRTIKTKAKTEEFETIVWQSSVDYESDANGLTLYRKYSGMTVEDKLLDEQREDWEKAYPYVPVCSGVTLFTIQVPKGDSLIVKWPGSTMPPGIIVTISFSEPYEAEDGTWQVPEEDKFTRTIAVDRTRNLKFEFVPDEEETEETARQEDEQDEQDEEDEQEESKDGQDLKETEKGAVDSNSIEPLSALKR